MEKIELKGMQRFQGGINTNPEGSCDEIINLRKKDGQWTLFYQKEELYDLTAVTHIDDMILWYKHPVTADELFICYDTNAAANQIKEIISSTSVANILLTLASGEVCSKIYHFGDYLIVVTDLNVYYIKYDRDTSAYVLLPDLEHGLYSFSTYYQPVLNPDDSREVVTAIGQAADSIGYVVSKIRENINTMERKGKLSGHVFFRVAFKLVDGNVIMPTTPYYAFIGMPNYDGTDVQIDFDNTPNIEEDLTSNVKIGTWRYFGFPNFYLGLTVSQIAIINKYEGLIKSVAVYMSKPLMDRDHLVEEDDLIQIFTLPTVATDDSYIFPHGQSIFDYYKDIASFYEVFEISLSSLSAGIDYVIKPGDLNNLETKPALPIDNLTSHKIFGDVMYEYNSRLHVGNPTVRLGDGYNMSLKDNLSVHIFPIVGEQLELLIDLADPVYVGDTSALGTIYTVTTLIANNKEMTMIKEHVPLAIYKDGAAGVDNYIVLNSILSYPDDRATSIDYVLLSGGSYYVLAQITLRGHTYLNLAYSTIVNESKWENATETEEGLKTLMYKSYKISTLIIYIFPSEDNLYQDTNRVQASFINNPIFYPAENSYRVGRVTNEIRGIMSQAVPMSEGQYGYYPLMVFSSEGIFSLEQGTGQILYKSIQPVSLDVCNNTDSVIAINGGIMFASAKGLMVLYGRSIDEISKQLEGTPKDNITSETNYIAAIDGSGNVTNLTGAIDTVEFKDYLTGAKIAYDINNDEIIVSNDSKGYSYVFSVLEKVWYKIDQIFSDFIINHPDWLGLNGNKVYNLSTEDTGATVLPDILIKTNPFKFNVNKIKSIERLVARFSGDFGHTSGRFVVLYVYGSLNGKEWKLITGLKVDHTSDNMDNNFLMLRKIRTSAKYFIIFMASTTPYQFLLDSFEFDVKVKIPEKLR